MTKIIKFPANVESRIETLEEKFDRIEALLLKHFGSGESKSENEEKPVEPAESESYVVSDGRGPKLIKQARIVHLSKYAVTISLPDGTGCSIFRKKWIEAGENPKFSELKKAECLADRRDYLINSTIKVEKPVHMKCVVQRGNNHIWRVKWRNKYGSIFRNGVLNDDEVAEAWCSFEEANPEPGKERPMIVLRVLPYYVESATAKKGVKVGWEVK